MCTNIVTQSVPYIWHKGNDFQICLLFSGLCCSLWHVKLLQIFLNQFCTLTVVTQVPRDNPKPTSVYLRAAKKIGKNDIISIVPGHWIDSQSEPGAAGEREFNLEVSLTIHRTTYFSMFYVSFHGHSFKEVTGLPAILIT